MSSLIEYYDAFEALLGPVRALGEYRTHFGFLETPSPDYCFFKAICNISRRQEAQAAMDRLHQELFGKVARPPQHLLDVGFGCGGTLQRLAQAWPASDLHGINLNAGQHAIASQLLDGYGNVTLHRADFLSHDFAQRFDLIYFIESAFHVADKQALVSRLADLLAPSGHVFIVDIFQSPRLSRRAAASTRREELFDYRSLEDWEQLLNAVGLEGYAFEDWSVAAAHHTRVSTPEPQFLTELVAPALPRDARAAVFERHLLHAYHGYARLSRLLARQLLRYGILRCQKR